MQIRFTFKHMETSQALEKYAQDKINERVIRWVTKPVEAHIFFGVDKDEHQAKCVVKGGDGFSFEVDGICSDMYGSIDLLVDKLAKRLRKQKEKIKNHKGVSNVRSLPIARRTADSFDADALSVDAEDVIKYEKARQRMFGKKAS